MPWQERQERLAFIVGKQVKKIGSKTRPKKPRQSAPDSNNWLTTEERRMMELRLEDLFIMLKAVRDKSRERRLQEGVQTVQRELMYDDRRR
jgi:hypothetical protein